MVTRQETSLSFECVQLGRPICISGWSALPVKPFECLNFNRPIQLWASLFVVLPPSLFFPFHPKVDVKHIAKGNIDASGTLLEVLIRIESIHSQPILLSFPPSIPSRPILHNCLVQHVPSNHIKHITHIIKHQ